MGREFVDHYLIPMTAAIWSAQPRAVLDFPAHFLIGFFRNHGLLQVWDRPQWKTIPGGAKRYVAALLAPLADRVRLNSPVSRVVRHSDYVEVTTRGGTPERFDAVVCATHADQTLEMLADADETERQVLAAFPYQRNDAVLHTDVSILPRRRRAWASWNYHLSPEPHAPATVTYDLSRLQRVNSPEPILLTLNDGGRIDPAKVIRRILYHHPAYGPDSIAAQKRHAELNGRRRTWFCGAYWGYGFHEDGVRSGWRSPAALGKIWRHAQLHLRRASRALPIPAGSPSLPLPADGPVLGLGRVAGAYGPGRFAIHGSFFRRFVSAFGPSGRWASILGRVRPGLGGRTVRLASRGSHPAAHSTAVLWILFQPLEPLLLLW